MFIVVDTFGNGGKISITPHGQQEVGYQTFLGIVKGCGAFHNSEHKTYTTAETNLFNIVTSLQKAFNVLATSRLKTRIEELIIELETLEESVVGKIQKDSQRLQKDYGITPFPHQIEGAVWIASKNRCILVDDPGLGKTGSSCLSFNSDHVLVIGPSIAKGVWKKEIPIWRPDYSPFLVKSTKDFRWPNTKEVVILSYGMLPPTLAELESDRKLKKPKYSGYPSIESFLRQTPERTTLVIDEGHEVSNPKTKRHQRILKVITSVINRSGTILVTTGTPLPNRLEQLYQLLDMLFLSQETFGSRKRFDTLFNARYGAWGGVQYPDPEVVPPHPEAKERLARVMLRRTREQVRPDLPEKVHQVIELDAEDISAKAVRKKLTRLMEELGEEVVLDNASLLNWLQNQSRDFKEISKLRKEIAIAKIPAMLKVVADYEQNNIPLVVASYHVEPLKELAKRDGWDIITGEVSRVARDRIIDDFMSGKLIGIGISIGAGKTAISLHRAAHMLFVDKSWTPADNIQTEDRIYRGLVINHGCFYITLALDHPLESRIQQVLTYKERVIQHTIDAVAGVDTLTEIDRLKILKDQLETYVLETN